MAQSFGGDLLGQSSPRREPLHVLLHRGRRGWKGGIGWARKQQIAQVLAPPMLAEDLEQQRRERNVAILLAFALANANDHALGVDVGSTQREHFAEPKPCAV